MSKTLKDGKVEKELLKKGGVGKKWTRRPPPKEKGGRKSLEEILDDVD